MAEFKTVMVVPLSSTNYSMWKIQYKIALIRYGLWGIVNEPEMAPMEGAEAQVKFVARHGKSLATIVLMIEPSLLYLTVANGTNS